MKTVNCKDHREAQAFITYSRYSHAFLLVLLQVSVLYNQHHVSYGNDIQLWCFAIVSLMQCSFLTCNFLLYQKASSLNKTCYQHTWLLLHERRQEMGRHYLWKNRLMWYGCLGTMGVFMTAFLLLYLAVVSYIFCLLFNKFSAEPKHVNENNMIFTIIAEYKSTWHISRVQGFKLKLL